MVPQPHECRGLTELQSAVRACGARVLLDSGPEPNERDYECTVREGAGPGDMWLHRNGMC